MQPLYALYYTAVALATWNMCCYFLQQYGQLPICCLDQNGVGHNASLPVRHCLWMQGFLICRVWNCDVIRLPRHLGDSLITTQGFWTIEKHSGWLNFVKQKKTKKKSLKYAVLSHKGTLGGKKIDIIRLHQYALESGSFLCVFIGYLESKLHDYTEW